MKRFLLLFSILVMITSCNKQPQSVSPATADPADRGVAQCAALWRAEDGTQADFEAFVEQWRAKTPEARRELFDKEKRPIRRRRRQDARRA